MLELILANKFTLLLASCAVLVLGGTVTLNEREFERVRQGFAASPGIIYTVMAVTMDEELK